MRGAPLEAIGLPATPRCRSTSPLRYGARLTSICALVAATAAFGQSPSLDGAIGYKCADGTQWNVNSCNGSSDDATCGVYRLDLPVPPIGFRVPASIRRGDLIKRISACKPHRVAIVRGEPVMGEPISPAPPARTIPARKQAAGGASPASAPRRAPVQTVAWGPVTYGSYGASGGYDPLERIGDMSVVTSGYGPSGYCVTQIGGMPVETQFIGGECVMVRIGDLEVAHEFSVNAVRYTRIGDMPVDSLWCSICGPEGVGRWHMTYVGRR